MNTLTTQLGDAKASINALETENEELKSDIDRLTSENILTETEIVKLQAQTDDIEKQFEEELQSTNSKVDEVEEHHNQLSLGLSFRLEIDY